MFWEMKFSIWKFEQYFIGIMCFSSLRFDLTQGKEVLNNPSFHSKSFTNRRTLYEQIS